MRSIFDCWIRPARTRRLIGLVALLAGTISLSAQTFTVLHTFTGGADGVMPESLVLAGNTLYGTTYEGGTNDSGTVFSVNTNGGNYTLLHTFAPLQNAGDDVPATNADGSTPLGALVPGGNMLYGTAFAGGTNGWGTVYAMTTNGMAFTVLFTFPGFAGRPSTNSTGNEPSAGLVLSGNSLYGVASNGGTNKGGTLFSLNTDGTSYTVLHDFAPMHDGINLDGLGLGQSLLLSGGTLYGPALLGGSDGVGTVFSCDLTNAVFSVLHAFSGFPDGINPDGAVIVAGDTLFGATITGGTNDWGAIYSLPTAGGPDTLLHSFSSAGEIPFTNYDGAEPHGAMTFSGGRLYGTATAGGAGASGTIFCLGASGNDFGVLHSFGMLNTNLAGVQTNWDGAAPASGVIVCGNTLYGVAPSGGTNGDGVVFSLALPRLTVASSSLAGTNLVLTVLNGQAGSTYTLLTSTNLTLPPSQWSPVATNVPSISGNFTVTTGGPTGPAPTGQFYILQTQ